MKRLVHYFESYGAENTEAVPEAVASRLWDGDISALVVASTSGATAVRFAPALEGRPVRAMCVSDPPRSSSYPGVTAENRRLLEALGVQIIDRVPYASTSISWGASDNVYGAVDLRVVFFDAMRVVGGNGLKVAIEVGLMATDGGHVKAGDHLCCVGGTGAGADTAIIMKAAFSQDLFPKEPGKRPELYEILAMPMAKKWWW